jgi:putative RecB family exonuclease
VELFSHSRLASFEDCPKRFHYRYVLRIASESESIEGFMGKRVHEVLERLYLFAGRGLVPSLRRVLERYQQLWEAAYDAARVRVVRAETPPNWYRERGERCLTNYYRRHYPFDAEQTLGVEERVSFSLDEEGRYRIQGVVDRIARGRDGALEIHDYKTGRRTPPQEELDADRQLALYQIGVAARYAATGEEPVRLVWHYVQGNETRTSTRSPAQLEDLRRATMGLIDRIRAEERFEPRPGPLCRWCEYEALCPASAARDAGAGAPPARPPGADPVSAPEPPAPASQLPLF